MKQILILLCLCFFGCDSILGIFEDPEGCCMAYDYGDALFTKYDAACHDDWTDDNCDSILGDYDYHQFFEDESCTAADNSSSFDCWN